MAEEFDIVLVVLTEAETTITRIQQARWDQKTIDGLLLEAERLLRSIVYVIDIMI